MPEYKFTDIVELMPGIFSIFVFCVDGDLNCPVGMLFYSGCDCLGNEPNWVRLSWIYVHGMHRRKGLASKLFTVLTSQGFKVRTFAQDESAAKFLCSVGMIESEGEFLYL